MIFEQPDHTAANCEPQRGFVHTSGIKHRKSPHQNLSRHSDLSRCKTTVKAPGSVNRSKGFSIEGVQSGAEHGFRRAQGAEPVSLQGVGGRSRHELCLRVLGPGHHISEGAESGFETFTRRDLKHIHLAAQPSEGEVQRPQILPQHRVLPRSWRQFLLRLF